MENIICEFAHIYKFISTPPPHFLDHPSPFLDHPSPTPQKFQLGLHSIPPKNPSYSIPPPPKMVFDVSPIFHTPSPPLGAHTLIQKMHLFPPNSSKGRCQKHLAGGGGVRFFVVFGPSSPSPQHFSVIYLLPPLFWLPSPPFLS